MLWCGAAHLEVYFQIRYFPLPSAWALFWPLAYSSFFWAITEKIHCTLWQSYFLPTSLTAMCLCEMGHVKIRGLSYLEHCIPMEQSVWRSAAQWNKYKMKSHITDKPIEQILKIQSLFFSASLQSLLLASALLSIWPHIRLSQVRNYSKKLFNSIGSNSLMQA